MSEAERPAVVEAPVMVEAGGTLEPTPRRTGRPWLDLVIALSAITISVVSLITGVMQSRTQERMEAASTWPFLSFTHGNVGEDGPPTISLSVINRGVGPALLKQVRMEYGGRPVTGFPELLQACCGWAVGLNLAELRMLPPGEANRRISPDDLAQVNGVFNSTLRGPYAPGERRVFFRLPQTDQNTVLWNRLNEAREDVRLVGCYCSALGECWRADLETMDQNRVRACPQPGPLDYRD